MTRKKHRHYKATTILATYDRMNPDQQADLQRETWLQAVRSFFRRISAARPTSSSSAASGSDINSTAISSRD
jgi:hypothetical protein